MPRTRVRPWRWLRWLLTAGLVGFLIFAAMVASWSNSEPADLEQAQAKFAAKLQELGSAPPYIDQDDVGRSFLHTELENPRSPIRLAELHAMVWLAESEELLQTHVPMWFVRIKDAGGNGLSLLLSVVEWDLDDLQLELDVAALERRGPALLLDRRKADGSRLLIWSSATSESP